MTGNMPIYRASEKNDPATPIYRDPERNEYVEQTLYYCYSQLARLAGATICSTAKGFERLITLLSPAQFYAHSRMLRDWESILPHSAE